MAIRKRLPQLGILLLVAVGLWFAHKPVWNGFKNWRAGQLLEQSRRFAAANEWSEARRTAVSAFQLTKSVEAFRLVFETMYQQRDRHALQAGAALFQHPDAEPADRTRVLEIMIDSGDLLTAGKLLAGLGEAAGADPGMAYQRLRYLAGAGELQRAAEASEAFAGTPRNGEAQLLLIKAFVRSGRDEWQPAATRRLAELLGNPDRGVALRALAQLAGMPRSWITDELFRKAFERFGEDPGLTAADDLALATLRIGETPGTLDDVADEMIAKYRAEDLAALTAWLGALEEWERVVEATAGVEELDPASFENRLNALQRLERYEELRESLANPPVSAPRPLLLAARAAVESKLGNESRAVILWKQAFEAAGADPNENFFYQLAAIARETGAKEREMEATAYAVEHRLGAPPPAERLVPLFFWLHRTGAHARLLSISYRLLQREPANAVLINNYHYLRCLQDESSKHAVEIMKHIVENFPGHASYRGTLALAQLRAGEPEEALATLDAIGPDPAGFDPSELAIYAAALAAIGRGEEARVLAGGIDWRRFPREEAKSLQGLIGE
ncbi:MAG: hypothetical protein HKO57_04765 [Akkermansiaceae bacterium]|nr:hypothetical protein [Akkermansiaceae bacterium]